MPPKMLHKKGNSMTEKTTPTQEPVAWCVLIDGAELFTSDRKIAFGQGKAAEVMPLYTHPIDAAAQIAYWQGRSESWERDAKVLQEQIAKLQDDIEFMRTCVEEACKDRKYFEEQASEKNRWQNKAENAAAQIAEITKERDQLKFIAQSFAAQEGREQKLMEQIAKLEQQLEGQCKANGFLQLSALKPMSDEEVFELWHELITGDNSNDVIINFARRLGVPKP